MRKYKFFPVFSIYERAVHVTGIYSSPVYRAGQCRTNPWLAVRTEPWCRNTDAGFKQLTTGRNAYAGLIFLRHSGIYTWFFIFQYNIARITPSQLSMDVQGVSLSITSSMDVQGVSLSTTSSMDVQGLSLSTTSSMDGQGVSLSTASSMNMQCVPLF